MDKADFRLLIRTLMLQVLVIIMALVVWLAHPAAASPRISALYMTGFSLFGCCLQLHAIFTIKRFYEPGRLP